MARTIFTGAKLYDGKASGLDGMTVVIDGEVITHVMSDGDLDLSGRTIDLAGKTMMPGMTVGHWHGEFVDIGPPLFGGERAGVFLGTEEPPAILALYAAAAMRNALHSGVMQVVSASCSNNLDGQIKMAVSRGLIEGPNLTPCSRHVVTTGDYEDRGLWWRSPAPVQAGVRRYGHNVYADGAADLVKAVREEILFGADIIKILPSNGHGFGFTETYRGLSFNEMKAVVETAHERDKRVRAHVTGKAAIMQCLEVGVDILDHCDYLDDECIAAMVEKGAFYVPSAFFAKLVSGYAQGQPLDRSNPADMGWLNLLEMLPRANEAGVKIVPGDDYGGQGALHEPGVYARELSIYIDDFGIDPVDVIRWATCNGAELALEGERTGTIEVGKRADLLIVDGDPGEDISLLQNPEANLKVIVQNGYFVKDRLANEIDARVGASGKTYQLAV